MAQAESSYRIKSWKTKDQELIEAFSPYAAPSTTTQARPSTPPTGEQSRRDQGQDQAVDQVVVDDSAKKRLNVDSPSFTPATPVPTLGVNGTQFKVSGLSPKAANAAPFKPKSFVGKRRRDLGHVYTGDQLLTIETQHQTTLSTPAKRHTIPPRRTGRWPLPPKWPSSCLTP